MRDSRGRHRGPDVKWPNFARDDIPVCVLDSALQLIDDLPHAFSFVRTHSADAFGEAKELRSAAKAYVVLIAAFAMLRMPFDARLQIEAQEKSLEVACEPGAARRVVDGGRSGSIWAHAPVCRPEMADEPSHSVGWLRENSLGNPLLPRAPSPDAA